MSAQPYIKKAWQSNRLRDIFRILASGGEDDIWKKNLIIMSITQFIVMVGMSSCVPFLPLYIFDLGVDSMAEAQVWSGFIFGGPFMLSILFVPLWGVLGDKYGQKLMVLRAVAGLGITVSLMGFAQTPAQLLALRIIQGAISGFVAASLGFISANTPRERSGFAIGLLQSSLSAGNILGPSIGGILSDISGFRSVFVLVGVLCLICGLLVWFFVKEDRSLYGSKDKPGIMDNLRFVAGKADLKILLIMVLAAQGGVLFTNPIFPYFVEKLNAPGEYLSTITGVLIGIVGVFSIFFAPLWGRRNDSGDFRTTLRLGAGVSGMAIAAHILMPEWYWLFPLRIIIGIFFAAIVPTIFSAISKRTGKDNSGGIMGLASSATILGSFISFVSSGFIASNFGMEWCFVVSGSMLLLVALLTGIKVMDS